MRVEAAEAAERARQQAALEQQRLQQEMELRRAEVAKKRPTWMLAVTGIALVAAVALVFFAIQKMRASEEDKEAKARAEQVAAQAKKDAEEAKEAVARLERESEDLKTKMDQATDLLAAAQTQADRDAANSKLRALREQRAEMERRIAEAKAKAARAERLKGVKIDQKCLDNPLAKGCS